VAEPEEQKKLKSNLKKKKTKVADHRFEPRATPNHPTNHPRAKKIKIKLKKKKKTGPATPVFFKKKFIVFNFFSFKKLINILLYIKCDGRLVNCQKNWTARIQ
jgi:hypothetical protein